MTAPPFDDPSRTVIFLQGANRRIEVREGLVKTRAAIQ
jgi:hypothetical protein